MLQSLFLIKLLILHYLFCIYTYTCISTYIAYILAAFTDIFHDIIILDNENEAKYI